MVSLLHRGVHLLKQGLYPLPGNSAHAEGHFRRKNTGMDVIRWRAVPFALPTRANVQKVRKQPPPERMVRLYSIDGRDCRYCWSFAVEFLFQGGEQSWNLNEVFGFCGQWKWILFVRWKLLLRFRLYFHEQIAVVLLLCCKNVGWPVSRNKANSNSCMFIAKQPKR